MYFLFYFCYIYIIIGPKINTTSFQTNHYSHLPQTGQLGLKILAGEDLSYNLFIAYGDRKRIQQMHDGDNIWKKKKKI